jgi:heme-degrading monooxygenase HmoA
MRQSPFAVLPKPPYFSVTFSSKRSGMDTGYEDMAERMQQLASKQDGYLGIESARADNGFGITVSYWTSLEAILAWRTQAEHKVAQNAGREQWYEHYEVRIARVERSYGMPAQANNKNYAVSTT